MKIHIIPCLSDNYAYVTEIFSGRTINILIDAPEFSAVDRYLAAQNMNLDFIFSTHHHWDHIGGNLLLKEKFKCKIFGAQEDAERIPGIDVRVKPDETFKVGDVQIQTMMVPGHTSRHVIYYFNGCLFSGDTLFSMGCGRLFEGTYGEMYRSLQKIKSLPPDTKIYCGHEYSEKNARFALREDPKNEALTARYEEVLKLRAENKPTVPTTLALEMQINPFLRASSIDEFAKLRQLRDSF